MYKNLISLDLKLVFYPLSHCASRTIYWHET